ncbi:MAG: hypothetical protein IK016_06260 [Lachnospiraceae bacterium]|nr:hypothetical protein [Lachnospiraceae bacterium]
MGERKIIDIRDIAKKKEKPKLYTSEYFFIWEEGRYRGCGVGLHFYTGASVREGNIIERTFVSEPLPMESTNTIIYEMVEGEDLEKGFCDAIILSSEEVLCPEQYVGVIMEEPYLMLELFDRHKRRFNMMETENAFQELAQIRVTGRSCEFEANYVEGT